MMMIRAFRTPMKTVNRILLSLAPLPKCHIQVNRSCGSTMARSLSPTKKRRNSRNTPRSNLRNHRHRVRGNVESNDFLQFLETFSAKPDIAHLRAGHHPCFPSRSVFLSPLTAPLTTRHAQPHPLHNPQSKGLYFSLFPPQKDIVPYSAVFSALQCWLPPSNLYMSLPMSCPPCYPYLSFTFLVSHLSRLLRVWMW